MVSDATWLRGGKSQKTMIVVSKGAIFAEQEDEIRADVSASQNPLRSLSDYLNASYQEVLVRSVAFVDDEDHRCVDSL
jgi:hypothetical protein